MDAPKDAGKQNHALAAWTQSGDFAVAQKTRDRCPTKVTLSVGSVVPSTCKQGRLS